MKKQNKFDKKLAIIVLKELFYYNKRNYVVINSYTLAERILKKRLTTVLELEALLFAMQKLELIDLVANNAKKGYNYKIKLQSKGEFFLKENLNKLSDFFVGVFVYVLFFGLICLLIFALKNIFSY